ncbi:hypothetical protein [Yinghuangia seranimata]|uniref:hypothetical protein n=1 Tax=Yinghuangia seranimata TaxID=408067 RepID=UPI00248CD4AE|nr:hypothetical protein [Yinghuangia seranimata]MDI2132231.1 hypothetical protein [Yinghuangia seranimata]
MARPSRGMAIGALIAATAATVLVASPASADGSGGASGAPSGKTPKICSKVDAIEARLDKSLTRLNGDQNTIGSIARMQARFDRQKAAGHAEVATYLQDRLTTRQALVPLLTKSKTDLAKVKDWCATQPPVKGKE